MKKVTPDWVKLSKSVGPIMGFIGFIGFIAGNICDYIDDEATEERISNLEKTVGINQDDEES